jgi:PAS domain-containing protein
VLCVGQVRVRRKATHDKTVLVESAMDAKPSKLSKPKSNSGAPAFAACVITLDSARRIRRWTRDAQLLFGHARDTAEGRPLTELAPFVSAPVAAAEGFCVRADGSLFRGALAPLQAAAAGADPALCELAVMDVTARYLREQFVLDSVADGVLSIDGRGRIASLNASASRIQHASAGKDDRRKPRDSAQPSGYHRARVLARILIPRLLAEVRMRLQMCVSCAMYVVARVCVRARHDCDSP